LAVCNLVRLTNCVEGEPRETFAANYMYTLQDASTYANANPPSSIDFIYNGALDPLLRTLIPRYIYQLARAIDVNNFAA
jgi:hypothetical protein